MIDGIIDAIKGQALEALTDKLGLNGQQVDNVLDSSKEAVESTVAEEAKNNGVDTMLNLFSGNDNSSSANNLLSSLGGNLISSLTKNGFDSNMSSQIKDIVLPILMNYLSSKIGGDSSNLSGMLGGLLGSNSKSDSLLGSLGSGFAKNLFK
ncbi:hypothetical protein [Wenyingzhuangia sp. 2_MG-2023]|uniref:hypothetical protein n=1 Tax=Wenyingzhuangia sp. 2_MG-2023 TaxID=3062639 RepID=UPI0026E29D79|nr:hypothetical protein [Wenyingzhuangia sp. 2_MG-2023]MDO6736543.1 hypothetical protein [Wenyingzhuangia sp. 2_MG-2023]